MNKKKKVIYSLIASIAFLIVLFVVEQTMPTKVANGSAPGGLQTRWATSSYEVFAQAPNLVLFATSSACTARVVTTQARPIMIKFGDHAGFSLTSNVGNIQAASTTLMYDAGLYGCDLWTASNAGDSATSAAAVVTEFRDFR